MIAVGELERTLWSAAHVEVSTALPVFLPHARSRRQHTASLHQESFSSKGRASVR